MGTDVVTVIEINRPRPEVADYVSDPDNAPKWYENIKRVEWKTPKPLEVGSKLAFEAEFMGQDLKYTYEIKEYVPGELLVMSASEAPFEMRTSYKFSDTPNGGTKMELGNLAHDSEMAKGIEQATRKDLVRLKSMLEDASS
jgi:uncharacterized protein YndB with AHSA1/START domain